MICNRFSQNLQVEQAMASVSQQPNTVLLGDVGDEIAPVGILEQDLQKEGNVGFRIFGILTS